MYIYKLSGIVRAAAKEGRKVVEGVLLPHRGWGLGFGVEEEPSVSLQTPPCTAHCKCSLISSATTNTGPQGKREKQMESRRGGPVEGGGADQRGVTFLRDNQNAAAHFKLFFSFVFF